MDDEHPMPSVDRTLEKYQPKRKPAADLALSDIAQAPAALVPDYNKEAELEIRSSIKRYYDLVADYEAVRTENDRLRRRVHMLEEELGQNYLRAVMSLRNAELETPKG